MAYKLEKEKKISYPCFGSLDRATWTEDGKTFDSSSSLVSCLRDPESIAIRKLCGHLSIKREKQKCNTSLMLLSLRFFNQQLSEVPLSQERMVGYQFKLDWVRIFVKLLNEDTNCVSEVNVLL